MRERFSIGIPDKPGLRQICWKIMLGYLPLEKSRWDSVLMEQRRLYYSFVKDLIVEPELEIPSGSSEDKSAGNQSEEWSLFIQDNRMLEQIDKDVRRTLPDFAFFQLPIPYSPLCPLSIEPKKRKLKKKALKKQDSSNTESVSSVGEKTATDAELTGSPTAGTSQRQRTLHCSSLDLKWTSITRTTSPTLKRRQTVTVISPMAERKARDRHQRQERSETISSSTKSGNEPPPSPPIPNGFRKPTNLDLTKIRGMTAAAEETVGDKNKDKGEDEDEEDEEEEDQDETDFPEYLFSPIPTRRSLFKRVAHLNQDFGSRQHQPHSLKATRTKGSWTKERQNTQSDGQQELRDSPQSNSPEPHEDSDGISQDDLPQDLHWEAIERILFIYAKLNPGIGYVQGMNEILGPLYYLLANDPEEVSRAHAEAESFWLFHLLMAHFRDHFVRSLDRDRTSGIGSSIARMNARLRQFDEQLWRNLEGKGIAPEYYGFRWLTVLCTQEFEMPDVWRIWDTILADTGGVERDYDFLLDFGCAMVCHLRTDLLEGDFADNVKLLQNYPSVDIQPILHLATVIRERRVRGPVQKGPSKLHIKTIDTARENAAPRIWSARSFSGDYQSASSTMSFEHGGHRQDPKAQTIDGVQSQDRLDHNLE
ncbi:hypothetical protein BGZ65_003665, partial [Modicella reniformis]